MSSINFNCDNCGREVLGCTWVNGMKFCAKCYQETFVNNTTFTNKTPSPTETFVDLLNKEMYELKIADLEAKLAESEKKFIMTNNLRKNSDEVLLNYKTEKYGLDKTIQELREMKLSLPEKEWYYKGFENCERQMSSHIADLTLEVKELKQQHAEKNKEIEVLKEELDDKNFCKDFADLYSENKILRQGHNLDKIELLEKIIKIAKDIKGLDWCKQLCEQVNTLIKEIKGE